MLMHSSNLVPILLALLWHTLAKLCKVCQGGRASFAPGRKMTISSCSSIQVPCPPPEPPHKWCHNREGSELPHQSRIYYLFACSMLLKPWVGSKWQELTLSCIARARSTGAETISNITKPLSHWASSTGIGLPILRQQRGHAADSIGQGIVAGGVQDKSLFCYGAHSLVHLAPWGEICFHPFGLLKGPENLALPIGLGLRQGHPILGVASKIREDLTSTLFTHWSFVPAFSF